MLMKFFEGYANAMYTSNEPIDFGDHDLDPGILAQFLPLLDCGNCKNLSVSSTWGFYAYLRKVHS